MLFTTAETACPAVASLLQLEKAGGSYLAGLGPSSARSAAGGGRRQPFVARGGKGQRGQLSPRALVLIDTASGCRFKVGACGWVLRGGLRSARQMGAELCNWQSGLSSQNCLLSVTTC